MRDKQPDSSGAKCAHCFDRKHQLARHLHFLRIGNEQALAGHLMQNYGPEAEVSGQIGALLAWVRNIHATHSDKVDVFGRPLPAWEAWMGSQGVTTEQIAAWRPTRAA